MRTSDLNGEGFIMKCRHHIRRPEEFKALAEARRIKDRPYP